MNTSVSPDSSDLSVFLCSCLHFLPHCDSLPLPSPPPPSHNYPHSISTSLPHTLTFMPFHALLLSLLLSSAFGVDPPPIPPCHIITTSPRGPVSAPCTSPMRGADEEATTASSRRRRRLQTGLEPSTSTFTSQTGSPLLSSAAWTAPTLQFQLDPEIHSRGDPQRCRICVWTVSSVPLWPIWMHETAVGLNKQLLWLLAYCLSSLAEWDHCIIAAQSLNNVLEV